MSRTLLSPASAGLLRALLASAEPNQDRILLSEWRATDWQSLTFVGERHAFELRVGGPSPALLANQLTAGLAEREFAIPGHIVVDILQRGPPLANADGSLTIAMEALTLVHD